VQRRSNSSSPIYKTKDKNISKSKSRCQKYKKAKTFVNRIVFKNESMTTELHHSRGKVPRNINQDQTNKVIKTKMNKKSVRIMHLKVKSNMASSSSKTIVVMVGINIKNISMKINNLTNKNQRLSKQIKVDNRINSLYLCPKNNRTIKIPGINTIPMN
jgi:hypothetical protein